MLVEQGKELMKGNLTESALIGTEDIVFLTANANFCMRKFKHALLTIDALDLTVGFGMKLIQENFLF